MHKLISVAFLSLLFASSAFAESAYYSGFSEDESDYFLKFDVNYDTNQLTTIVQTEVKCTAKGYSKFVSVSADLGTLQANESYEFAGEGSVPLKAGGFLGTANYSIGGTLYNDGVKGQVQVSYSLSGKATVKVKKGKKKVKKKVTVKCSESSPQRGFTVLAPQEVEY